jgi:hypothetical protein
LSLLALASALVATAGMLVWDLAFNGTHPVHAALPLALIGLSYTLLQFSSARPNGELLKGVLLGVAFMLWGAELVLPRGALATRIDCLVVLIFVGDLGYIIAEHLRRKDHELP